MPLNTAHVILRKFQPPQGSICFAAREGMVTFRSRGEAIAAQPLLEAITSITGYHVPAAQMRLDHNDHRLIIGGHDFKMENCQRIACTRALHMLHYALEQNGFTLYGQDVVPLNEWQAGRASAKPASADRWVNIFKQMAENTPEGPAR